LSGNGPGDACDGLLRAMCAEPEPFVDISRALRTPPLVGLPPASAATSVAASITASGLSVRRRRSSLATAGHAIGLSGAPPEGAHKDWQQQKQQQQRLQSQQEQQLPGARHRFSGRHFHTPGVRGGADSLSQLLEVR